MYIGKYLSIKQKSTLIAQMQEEIAELCAHKPTEFIMELSSFKVPYIVVYHGQSKETKKPVFSGRFFTVDPSLNYNSKHISPAIMAEAQLNAHFQVCMKLGGHVNFKAMGINESEIVNEVWDSVKEVIIPPMKGQTSYFDNSSKEDDSQPMVHIFNANDLNDPNVDVPPGVRQALLQAIASRQDTPKPKPSFKQRFKNIIKAIRGK